MSKRTHILLIFLGVLLLTSPLAAVGKEKNRVVWTKKPNSSTGLYTSKNYFVSHGVGGNVSALYYFGDVDNEGLAFHGGFNVHNLSIGGGLSFFYNLPISNHCNLRFSLLGGTIHGNNELKFSKLNPPRDDYRKFNAVLVQPAVGVQYYPFSNAGFYLYGGVAVAGSIITNYEFYYYPKKDAERKLLKGKTFGILPMVQLAIGYTWRLTNSWSMGLEVMIQEGLIDTHYMNLDAFPLAKSQNSDGVELGNSFGKWTDRYGKEHIHWNDGWFQVGLTVTYHWRNCEHCRIINNYSRIKPKRR